MPAVYASANDNVKETSASTGTGDYVLGGAVTGAITFLASGYSDGNIFPYFVSDGGGGYETGLGKYNSGPNSVSRFYVWESSNAGDAVNWGTGVRAIGVGIGSLGSVLTTMRHIQNNVIAPAAYNDNTQGFGVLSLWSISSTGRIYVCVDNSTGAAVWVPLASTPIGSSAASQASLAIGGVTNTSGGTATVIIGGGHNNIANTVQNAYAIGSYAQADHNGGFAYGTHHSSGTTVGQHQLEDIPLALQTTTVTTARMLADGSSTQRLVIPVGGAWNVICKVIGYDYTNFVVSQWTLGGLYRRDGSSAPALVGSVTGGTATAQDAGASAWVATLAIDTGNNAIDVNVTGAASTTINWTARFSVEQVTA